MTDNDCMKLIERMNTGIKNTCIISMNKIIDMALIPINDFYNKSTESEIPIEYKKVFFLKYENKYAGCFFANTGYMGNQTDLQLFILEDYRGKIDYISSFSDYVFPSLFVDFDKLTISFKHEKIKSKFSKIDVLSKLKQIKGKKVTIVKKEIQHLLKNNFSYLKNDLNLFITKYNSLKLKLEPLLKKSSLDSVIKGEKFSTINNSYISYYYNNHDEDIINLHAEAVELYFLIKMLK